jgi:hypothetical protein
MSSLGGAFGGSNGMPSIDLTWLVEWSAALNAAVWTFDREFSTVWRTGKGKRVKLVP